VAQYPNSETCDLISNSETYLVSNSETYIVA